MKRLDEIVLKCGCEDEKIDNLCVDEYIACLKDTSIEKSGGMLDALSYLKDINVDYDELSKKMKEKLQKSREKGRNSWWNETCPITKLIDLYMKQKKKDNEDNEIDICIYSMFLHFKINENEMEI
ncbi:hypothetical protein N5U23_04120 [Aliarcobacter butzleri]|uniref:hypothetical protein n=1 Tax=Aliarcobacter butzleri TaxID=28197 RepID=UPI0021B34178|nr:hypothetical protein [Aliarcobacter butzleri]MCT7563197.1 hypothetical protein [Aliarcobacter butzleri]